ncbi:MAG TPA: nitroreductase family protein, partial [Hyphomicrobiaceae bacterium]|nr:nitroreductase family protein [Hyphomicrobiaceae bacterium]
GQARDAGKSSALEARYGREATPEAGPWNSVLDSLLAHRTVRGYKPDALPSGTLETLIAAAQSAATSSNLQTWSVVAVTDPAKKGTFAKIAGGQKHIEQCPLFLAFLADLSRLGRLSDAEGRNLELAGLPYLETFLVAAIDAALAAQNAVVAAESLGLATVYIGAMRNDPVRVAEELGLPPGAACVFGLCIGYALPTHTGEVKPRLAQPVVLHRERYASSEDAANRAAYDRLLEDFSRRNEMSAYTWTERVLNRIGKVTALSGRDRLKEQLRRLGFPLR